MPRSIVGTPLLISGHRINVSGLNASCLTRDSQSEPIHQRRPHYHPGHNRQPPDCTRSLHQAGSFTKKKIKNPRYICHIGFAELKVRVISISPAGFWTNSYIIANKFTNQHKPTDKKNDPPPSISPTMTTPHLPQTIILHNTPEILENYLA